MSSTSVEISAIKDEGFAPTCFDRLGSGVCLPARVPMKPKHTTSGMDILLPRVEAEDADSKPERLNSATPPAAA